MNIINILYELLIDYIDKNNMPLSSIFSTPITDYKLALKLIKLIENPSLKCSVLRTKESPELATLSQLPFTTPCAYIIAHDTLYLVDKPKNQCQTLGQISEWMVSKILDEAEILNCDQLFFLENLITHVPPRTQMQAVLDCLNYFQVEIKLDSGFANLLSTFFSICPVYLSKLNDKIIKKLKIELHLEKHYKEGFSLNPIYL